MACGDAIPRVNTVNQFVMPLTTLRSMRRNSTIAYSEKQQDLMYAWDTSQTWYAAFIDNQIMNSTIFTEQAENR